MLNVYSNGEASVFALIESCPDHRPGFGWTGKAISFVVHAFVISAAIAATNGVVKGRGYHPAVDLIWVAPPPPANAPPDANPIPGLPGTAPMHTLTLPTTIPVDIPLPGTLPVDSGTLVTFNDPGTPGTDPAGTAVVPGAPLAANLVDELPVLLSHPTIVYPEVLRQAGIEGRVMVETVLDTLGHAEAAQTRVTKSGTDLFDREAMSVVLASRYRAARVQGHAVRVRIAVPVNFTLHR